jgi:hypothetical protein
VRIGLPASVSPTKAFTFAAASFLVQQIQHTDIIFSSLYFLFLMLSAFAFNTAGGFTRIAGAYYCWFSMLVCIIGVTWKMVLNEPGDSALQDPWLLMTLYDIAAAGFIVVALILRNVDLRHYELAGAGVTGKVNFTAAGLGCIMIAYANDFAGTLFGIAPGGVLSALRQLDQFLPLGIMLATIGAINDSKGKRSFNFVNIIGMLFAFEAGFEVFSKQGMFTPLVCWLIGVIYKRFDLRRSHLIGIALATFICFYALAPLSGARDYIKPDMTSTDRLVLAVDSIIHIDRTRAHVKELSGDEAPAHSYFLKPQNALIARLNMIGVDDALVHYGLVNEPIGIQNVIDDFGDLLPHFIAPNKVEPLTGNYYAHEVGGMLADADVTTGISFSPVGESFRVMRWVGVGFILPAVWLMLFASVEAVCGDLRTSPWTLLPILATTHIAPEGMLGGQIYMLGYGNAAYFFCILIATRMAPVLGRLFYGSAIADTATGNDAMGVAVDAAPVAA